MIAGMALRSIKLSNGFPHLSINSAVFLPYYEGYTSMVYPSMAMPGDFWQLWIWASPLYPVLFHLSRIPTQTWDRSIWVEYSYRSLIQSSFVIVQLYIGVNQHDKLFAQQRLSDLKQYNTSQST